jgi:hypothetical protein
MQKIGMERAGEFDHPMIATGHPLRRHVLYVEDQLPAIGLATIELGAGSAAVSCKTFLRSR